MTPGTPDSPKRDRLTLLTAIVCGGLVVAGAIAAVSLSRRLDPTGSPLTNQVEQAVLQGIPESAPATEATIEATIVSYWLRDTGSGFELTPVSETVTIAAADELATLKAALERVLLAAPDGEIQAIPAGVTLNRLDRQADGLYLDLSSKFTTSGGSAAMQGRLAQVLYTATYADPELAVWLSIEGEPLTLLGGEGLVVPYPITRDRFAANFSL